MSNPSDIIDEEEYEDSEEEKEMEKKKGKEFIDEGRVIQPPVKKTQIIQGRIL